MKANNHIKASLKKNFPQLANRYRFISNKSISIKNRMLNYFDAPIIVLLYHRVANLDIDFQQLAVSIENFDDQMAYLKNNFPILRFEDNWNNINTPSVVITFDDGYFDNYKNALPILEKYKLPATIFISTGQIGSNREFWWDDLERIILLNNALPHKYHINTSLGTYGYFFHDDIRGSYINLHRLLKKLQASEREKIIRQLEIDLEPTISPRHLFRTMNKDEIAKIESSSCISIGAHTITHTQLSIQSRDEQFHELLESKKILEDILKKDIYTFSYPFGTKNDYNDETIKILKSIGYKKVASNYFGQIHSWNKNNFEIPRFLIRNWNLEEFKEHVNSFFYL